MAAAAKASNSRERSINDDAFRFGHVPIREIA
jgi:hypothetical protein